MKKQMATARFQPGNIAVHGQCLDPYVGVGGILDFITVTSVKFSHDTDFAIWSLCD